MNQHAEVMESKIHECLAANDESRAWMKKHYNKDGVPPTLTRCLLQQRTRCILTGEANVMKLHATSEKLCTMLLF